MVNYTNRYKRLSQFMKEYMIRKVTLRNGQEVYYGKNGELYTINGQGEKDYKSLKERYMMLSLLDVHNFERALLLKGQSRWQKPIRDLNGLFLCTKLNLQLYYVIPKN